MKRAAIALGLLLSFAGAYDFWRIARSTAAIDFYQMWVGARMARQTRDFYDPATGARMGEQYRRQAVAANVSRRHQAAATYRRNLEMFSTPFLYTLYAPLRGTYERDLFLFHLALFLSAAGAVAILASVLRWSAGAALIFFGLLLIGFEPLRSDFAVGNSNSFVLLLVAVAMALARHAKMELSGAALALAVVAKPHVAFAFPILYLFWIAARRRRDLIRHAAGAAMAAIAAVTAGSIYFRSATIWGEWLAALRALPDDIVPVDIGNFSLALIVRQLTGRHASAVLLLIVVAVTLFVAFRRRPARAGDTALIALGCVGLHLVSRLVWLHYYVLAIPLIMWLLRPAHGSPAVRRQIAGGVALLLIAVRPWDDFVPTAMQVAMLVNAGLLLAFGATLRDVSLLGQDGVKTEPERQ